MNIKIRSDIKHLQQPSLILGNCLVRGVVVSFRLAVHFIYLFIRLKTEPTTAVTKYCRQILSNVQLRKLSFKISPPG